MTETAPHIRIANGCRVRVRRRGRGGELLSGDTLRWWDAAANEPADDAAAAVVAALGRSAGPGRRRCARSRAVARARPAQGATLRAALETSSPLRARLLAAARRVDPRWPPTCAEHPDDWRVLLGDLDPRACQSGCRRRSAPTPPAPVAGTGGRARQRSPAATRSPRCARPTGASWSSIAGARPRRRPGPPRGHRDCSPTSPGTRCRPRSPSPRPRCRARPRRAGSRSSRMGKAGARELNYVSDVDVVFVGGADDRGRRRRRGARHGDPAGRRDDADLPAGGVGGRRGRCARRARTARSSAPSPATRRTTGDGRAPGSSRRCSRPVRSPAISPSAAAYRGRDHAAGVDGRRTSRLRRRRARDAPAGRSQHIPVRRSRQRDIKLGAGGLRDVEFAVQLLQLVHGRGDETLRVAATLPALDALRDGGYVGRDDAREPERRLPLPARSRASRCSCAGCGARTWCPTIRTELLVAGPGDGLPSRPPRRRAGGVSKPSGALHAREVRRLHEKLFYRPLLEAVAHVPSERPAADHSRGGAPAGGTRLRRSARRRCGTSSRSTAGLSRRAAFQRALLPVCSATSPTRRSRMPGCWRTGGLSDELGGDAVVPAAVARRRRGGVAAGLRARHQPLRRPDARPRA